jgi:hypothetical protein
MQSAAQALDCGGHLFRLWEVRVPAPTKTVSFEEFRVRAAHTGLSLTEEDIVELHKGYVGMLRLMERFPADWAAEAEPAHIFIPVGGAAR